MAIVYHVAIFSEFVPSIKKLFSSREEAYTYVWTYMERHFPLASLSKKLTKDQAKKLLEDGFHVATIDTEKCPRFREMFLDGGDGKKVAGGHRRKADCAKEACTGVSVGKASDAQPECGAKDGSAVESEGAKSAVVGRPDQGQV